MEPDTAATHDEIWEDSALVESWNQALEEYKVSESEFEVSKPRSSDKLTWSCRNTTASTPEEAQSTT
jgi:hypothetical protein